jgi:hypothetical protein
MIFKEGAMMATLRIAGDFNKKSVVEFATIEISARRGDLPTNLRMNIAGDPNELVTGLYPSPTGRITWQQLCLDSEELAYAFREHLRCLFEQRRYSDGYRLTVAIETSTETKTVTKLKLRHSAAAREILGLHRSFNAS